MPGDPQQPGQPGTDPGYEPEPTDPNCETPRSFFDEKLWGPVFTTCVSCHQSGGLAANTRLILATPNQPGFMATNFEVARTVAAIDSDEGSLLVAKAIGGLAHGGGQIVTPDSQGHADLEAFVGMLDRAPDAVAGECASGGDSPDDFFEGVAMLSPTQLLRKSVLQLAGRMPSDSEYARVESGGMAEIEQMLDSVMEEEAFLDTVRRVWNDILLTDRYLSFRGHAVSKMSYEDFPRSRAWYESQARDLQVKINESIAREPLELVAYIVRNNRPFTEIVTADYTVLNPFAAMVYDIPVSFDNPNDMNEWRPAKLHFTRNGQRIDYLHAGVLSQPMVLSRFPTTVTNRNRARARFVYKNFLATDVLKIAERPIDLESAEAIPNPTLNDPSCSTCHAIIDPLAGGYRNFNPWIHSKYEPNRAWHTDTFPTGFGDEVMPSSEQPRALAWMASRIVRDERFPLSMVQIMHRALTGQEPLEYPRNAAAPDYRARLRAWQAQDAYYRDVIETFVSSNYNLKAMVKAIVTGPYYRASHLQSPVSASRLAELNEVGTPLFSPPESLVRKIRAVSGVRWASNWNSAELLLAEYNLIYGGIDSDTVVNRLAAPSSVSVNVAWRMANEVACRATPYDFTYASHERVLFPHVELTDAPIRGGGGSEDAAIATRVRENIRYLHRQLLGEELYEGDPELDRTYNLFLETMREGQAAVASGAESSSLHSACRAERDANTGVTLPTNQQVRADADYVVRSWMAVVTYLLADYRFLFE